MDGRLSFRWLAATLAGALALGVTVGWLIWGAATVPAEAGVALLVLAIVPVLGVAWTRARAQAAADRREATAAEARMRDAIESLSDGLVLWNRDDHLVLVNPAMQRAEVRRGAEGIAPLIIGETFEGMIRRRVTLGLVAVPAGGEEAYIQARVARHGAPTGEPIEERYTTGDWVRVTERRTSDGGVVTIITDITDLKRSEAEMRDANQRLEAQ